MSRDAFIRYDDVVELWFDTFFDQRYAFWFQITAGGSRGDALLADSGSSFNKSWDGIWYGDVQTTEFGWVAELAFPLKTLAFDPKAPYWGFNITRKRVANGESGRWASPLVAYSFFQVSEGGRLTGFEGLRQGIGLDVVPFVVASADRDRTTGDDETGAEVGLDAFWAITPNTKLSLSINTDFAETEVDARQVNLTRFPLFFPEKRDFFLEDSGIFKFGSETGFRGGRADVINLFNTDTESGRFEDTVAGDGDPNLNYGRPSGFQQPRYVRLSARLVF